MGLKDDLIKELKNIHEESFEVKNSQKVPTISDDTLTFRNQGYKFDATVLYIDMRDSTALLEKHKREGVAKIHMSYYHVIVKIAKQEGGKIRSFNGDSLLVFFQGMDSSIVSKAVRAAMQMKYAIIELINKTIEAYSDINFGIGIDCGSILATKVGVGGEDETKDLIWIGDAVNRAAKISKECKDPTFSERISKYFWSKSTSFSYICISKDVYDILEVAEKGVKETKINGHDTWQRKDMEYNRTKIPIYITSKHLEIN